MRTKLYPSVCKNDSRDLCLIFSLFFVKIGLIMGQVPKIGNKSTRDTKLRACVFLAMPEPGGPITGSRNTSAGSLTASHEIHHYPRLFVSFSVKVACFQQSLNCDSATNDRKSERNYRTSIQRSVRRHPLRPPLYICHWNESPNGLSIILVGVSQPPSFRQVSSLTCITTRSVT